MVGLRVAVKLVWYAQAGQPNCPTHGRKLPVLAVNHAFQMGLAQALGDAPLHLTFAQHGVVNAASIVDRRILRNRDSSVFLRHFNYSDVSAKGSMALVRRESGAATSFAEGLLAHRVVQERFTLASLAANLDDFTSLRVWLGLRRDSPEPESQRNQMPMPVCLLAVYRVLRSPKR